MIIEAFSRLAFVADGQWGYLTTAQAQNVDVDRETIDALKAAQLIEDVSPGVLRLRAGGHHRMPRTYAAWLATEPATPAWERSAPGCAVVSHAAALRVWRAGDVPGPSLEFTVAPGASVAASPDIVLHTAALAPGDWREADDMPVTAPARTLVDIAGTSRLDVAELGRLAHVMLQSRIAGRDELAAALSGIAVDGNGADLLDEWLAVADEMDG